MQAIVLAGGIGSRLRPWTRTTPKPMLPMLDSTLLEQVVAGLPSELVDEVIIAAGYKVEQLREHYSNTETPWQVTVVPEEEPLGTGGALRNCMDHISGRFACFNGDIITSLNVSEMLKQHESKKCLGTLALWQVEDPTRFGIVGMEDDRSITRFMEKPKRHEVFSNYINAGSYILEEDVFDLMPTGRFSLEREVFPQLSEDGRLGGFPFSGYFIDAGTPQSWAEGVIACIENGRYSSGEIVGKGTWSPESVDVNTILEECMLGHEVSLGGGSIVRRSTLLSGSTVGSMSNLEECMVGENAIVGQGCLLKGVVVNHGSSVPPGHSQTGGAWPNEVD